LSELAERFLGSLPYPVFPHPTPHPPPVAILALPLGLLEYKQAAAVWLLLEIGCVILSVYLLLSWWRGQPSLLATLLTTLSIFALLHFYEELAIGQLMTLLLLLLISAWQALRSERHIWGGIALGCVVALKLISWPIIIFAALRRKWRTTFTAGLVIVIANVAAGLLMGFSTVINYYLRVGASILPLYRAHIANFSLWSLGWRVFDGTGSSVLVGVEAPPLVAAPYMAKLASWGIPLMWLVITLILAVRAHHLDISFAMLTCTSILVTPITWHHYLTIMLLPIAIAGRQLVVLNLPGQYTVITLLAGLLISIPTSALSHDIPSFFSKILADGESTMVPFLVSLTSLLPLLGVTILTGLLWRLDRLHLQNSESSQI
jgi:hypothetical protein